MSHTPWVSAVEFVAGATVAIVFIVAVYTDLFDDFGAYLRNKNRGGQ